MWYLSTLCFWFLQSKTFNCYRFLQSKTFNCYHVAIIGFSRPPHWPQYNAVQSKHYLKDCQLNLRTAKHHAEQGRQAVLDSSQEQYQHTARLIQVLLTLLWEEMDYCVHYSVIYRFWPQFRISRCLCLSFRRNQAQSYFEKTSKAKPRCASANLLNSVFQHVFL